LEFWYVYVAVSICYAQKFFICTHTLIYFMLAKFVTMEVSYPVSVLIKLSLICNNEKGINMVCM